MGILGFKGTICYSSVPSSRTAINKTDGRQTNKIPCLLSSSHKITFFDQNHAIRLMLLCIFLAENKFIYLVFTVSEHVCELLPNKMKCWMDGWISFYLFPYFWQQFFLHLQYLHNHYPNVPEHLNQTNTSNEKSAKLHFALHFANFIDLQFALLMLHVVII